MYRAAMRLLASARISRRTDESTSVDTQLEAVTRWATAYGHELIPVVPDLGVSGARPIRQREGIGTWLTDDRLDAWDGVITYKLDRLFRSQADYVDFYRDFCEKHSKVIISAGEGIDTSTEHGKFVADLLVAFAEMERGRMRVRRRDAQGMLRAELRWGGGIPAYGYEAYKDGGHWYLRPHAERAKITRWMADEVIKGGSVTSVSNELIRKEIPTMNKGGKWTATSVLRILRSSALRGYVLHQPSWKPGQRRPPAEIVIGDDGMPLRREPILDDNMWFKLQTALDRNASGSAGISRNPSPLLRVAFCALCRRPLNYAWHNVKAGKRFVYRCPGTWTPDGQVCQCRSIPAEWLTGSVEQWFLREVGKEYIWEKIYAVPDSSSADLAETEDSIARLEDLYVAGKVYKGPEGAERFAALMTKLTDRRAELTEKVAARSSAPRWRKTSRTFADEWAGRDVQGRRQLMVSAGLRAYAAVMPDGSRTIGFDLDENLAERAVRAASGDRSTVGPS
jgi:site-specific DNA recombinase